MESESQPINQGQHLSNSKDVQHAIREVNGNVKSQGLFDQFRKECLADVDTKPAYHNLVQRVEKFVERFLSGQKWSTDLNKNQLRETLRRQLNNSGVMNIGIDRIIEQVVNPKILLSIKPKIDGAVCDYLGIDLKVRQEEKQKQKQEWMRWMVHEQKFQHHHLQNMICQNVKTGDDLGAVAGTLPTPSTFPWTQAAVDVEVGFSPHTLGFGGMMQPMFMGSWAPGLPGMKSLNQTMQPLIPDQPLILDYGAPFIATTSPSLDNGNTSFSMSSGTDQSVANQDVYNISMPLPGPNCTHLLSSTFSSVSSPKAPGIPQQPSPVAPPGILTNPAGTVIKPPPPGSIPPPPGTVPVMTPASYTPSQISLQPIPTTPTTPALISHTVTKVLQEESTPEEVDLFKATEQFLPKNVMAKQTALGHNQSTCLPQVLYEAEITEHLTEHESQAANIRMEITEFEWLKGKREEDNNRKTSEIKFKDREDPLPLIMDIFQTAKDVSQNEETFDILTFAEEIEGKQKEDSILSADFDTDQLPPDVQLRKVDIT